MSNAADNATAASSAPPPLRKLVFSGGSTRAFCFIGCVRCLEREAPDALRAVDTVAGSSAGALVALMLVLGLTSDEMLEWGTTRLLRYRANQVDIDDMLDMYFSMGIDKGFKVAAFLAELLRSRLGGASAKGDITFEDLRNRTDRDLVVCASNLTTSTPQYFSCRSTPAASVREAVRASMCLPLFFSPVVMNDMMYADGGLFENLPLGAVISSSSPQPDQRSTEHRGHVLAVNVPWKLSPTLPTTVIQYALYLATSMLIRVNVIGRAVAGLSSAIDERDVTIVDVEPLPTTDDDVVTDDELFEDGNTPFLGFCIDDLEFKIDEQRVTRYVEMGYTHLKKTALPRLSRPAT